MKKLIIMTEYIKSVCIEGMKEGTGNREVLDKIVDYSRLLQTPLELGMFIPCKKNGELAENPEGELYGDNIQAQFAWSNYKGASDRVLFEGWEIHSKPKDIFLLSKHKDGGFWIGQHKTIEDLINSGIELIPTEACKKQLGI